MNERILELAEQAWAADCLENNPKWKRTDITDLVMKDGAGFHKKFAELIVRECATLAYDGPNGILEHFGVKE